VFVEKKNRVFLRFIDDETEDAFSRAEQIGNAVTIIMRKPFSAGMPANRAV